MKTNKISRGRFVQSAADISCNLENGAIAELLAREAEQATGHLRQAFRRAARKAFLWEEEVHNLVAAKTPLTELDGIGPFLADRLMEWFEKPPPPVSPPPLRAEFMTLARARRVLAKHGDWRASLQGELHTHTLWSDGSATIAEMGRAAKEIGYQYLSITDHTQGLKIANGLNEIRLMEQSEEIDTAKAVLDEAAQFRILKSAEVNLSPSGEVDIESAVLGKLDLVIGSFHSALRRREDQTDRYVAALRNKNIHILGHPQGRIFNHREGLKADWSRVFAEAARLDKAVEINAYPDRQDLKISLLHSALKEGARISLGTDAHHPWQLAFMDLALAAALLAGYQQDRIVNFMPVQNLLNWSSRVRAHGSK